MTKIFPASFLAASLVGVLVLTVGVSAAEAGSPRPTSVESPSIAATKIYSGEDVFKAVVFGQGELAKGLGDLVTPVNLDESVLTEIDRVSSSIKSTDPAFFTSFGLRAQSGDVYEVDDAFNDLDTRVTTALQRLGYQTATDDGTITPQCITVVLFAAAALVVGGVAVLTVAAVATTALYSTKTKVTSGPKAAGLTREKLIMGLTTALAK